MNSPLLEIQNASFAYEKDLVLENISLKITAREFVGVIGPNGSGKSTLLKLLCGALNPGTGSVVFKGSPVNVYKRKTLSRHIAWIPQEHPMVFPFKVAEIVLMGRHPYLSALAFEGEDDLRIANNAMEMTEVRQFSSRRFNQISGGEKQRVMIASAIAQESELMLLDEPTTALDIKYQLQILNILKRLNLDNQRTIVIAVHDLHLASKYCNRLILLDRGQVVHDGSPQQVLQKEVLEEVYGIKVKIIRDDEDGSLIVAPES